MGGNGLKLQFDIAVVGGSVAGAVTAAFLARRGLRVAVLDRARFPRDKPCGEGVMPHGVDVLRELGVLQSVRAAGARELSGVRYTLDSGESVHAAFPRAAGKSSTALGVRRLALDEILLDCARASGDVSVLERFTARALVCRSGRVIGVSDGRQRVLARVVVGADGIHSSVRRLLGWDASRSGPRRYAAVGHFRLPSGRSLPPEVEVLLAEGMEAYVTPLGANEALVALLGGRTLMRGFAGNLAAGYERAIRAQPRLACMLDGATLAPGVRATGPFAARASRVAGYGVLLVGDAAGFLDPITGEGMASALLQARAAARVIAGALRASGSPNLGAYSRAHRRITRTGTALTWVALSLCASAALRARAMTALQGRPGLFGKLLAINCDRAPLSAITVREWAALLSGH
ncbi:MAG: NAD(P)/FAD-dependent oxidoreductase [Dehalococcoidia bacterium]